MGKVVDVNRSGDICIVGATPNFFKVGHTTLREISQRYPNIHMRLALITEVLECPPAVKDLEESGQLTFYNWPRGDTRMTEFLGQEITMETKGLVQAFHGCTLVFFVPPIDGRVKAGTRYAKAAAIAGVSHLVVLGVQASAAVWTRSYPGVPIPKIVQDAEDLYQAMDAIFTVRNSGTQYAVIHTPMFLENLLYQTERLRGYCSNSAVSPAGTCDDVAQPPCFSLPLGKHTVFSYANCMDLGHLVSRIMVDFDMLLNQVSLGEEGTDVVRINSHRLDIYFATGRTTAAEIEQALQTHVKKSIVFQRQTRESFVTELKEHLDKSDQGAETIAGIYDELEWKHEEHLQPSTKLVSQFKLPLPQSMEDWIKDHADCFFRDRHCRYPLPPVAHQCAPPKAEDIVLECNICGDASCSTEDE